MNVRTGFDRIASAHVLTACCSRCLRSESRPIPPRFALVAGEASGDLLGAGLIAALRERFPRRQFAGVGGAAHARRRPRCVVRRPTNLRSWASPRSSRTCRGCSRCVATCAGALLAFKPDAFIGIDAPDFNLGLERKLKRDGHPHGALRQSVGLGLARETRCEDRPQRRPRAVPVPDGAADLRAPRRRRARSSAIRSPTRSRSIPTAGAARDALGLPDDVPVLAVLPGSRLGEIRRLGADFVGARRAAAQASCPICEVVAPMANAACRTHSRASRRAGRSPTGCAIARSASSTATRTRR